MSTKLRHLTKSRSISCRGGRRFVHLSVLRGSGVQLRPISMGQPLRCDVSAARSAERYRGQVRGHASCTDEATDEATAQLERVKVSGGKQEGSEAMRLGRANSAICIARNAALWRRAFGCGVRSERLSPRTWVSPSSRNDNEHVCVFRLLQKTALASSRKGVCMSWTLVRLIDTVD